MLLRYKTWILMDGSMNKDPRFSIIQSWISRFHLLFTSKIHGCGWVSMNNFQVQTPISQCLGNWAVQKFSKFPIRKLCCTSLIYTKFWYSLFQKFPVNAKEVSRIFDSKNYGIYGTFHIFWNCSLINSSQRKDSKWGVLCWERGGG